MLQRCVLSVLRLLSFHLNPSWLMSNLEYVLNLRREVVSLFSYVSCKSTCNSDEFIILSAWSNIFTCSAAMHGGCCSPFFDAFIKSLLIIYWDTSAMYANEFVGSAFLVLGVFTGNKTQQVSFSFPASALAPPVSSRLTNRSLLNKGIS